MGVLQAELTLMIFGGLVKQVDPPGGNNEPEELLLFRILR